MTGIEKVISQNENHIHHLYKITNVR